MLNEKLCNIAHDWHSVILINEDNFFGIVLIMFSQDGQYLQPSSIIPFSKKPLRVPLVVLDFTRIYEIQLQNSNKIFLLEYFSLTTLFTDFNTLSTLLVIIETGSFFIVITFDICFLF